MGCFAQVFIACLAHGTLTTANPRVNCTRFADIDTIFDIAANSSNFTGNFMAKSEWQGTPAGDIELFVIAHVEKTIDHVQIRMTNTAVGNFDQHLRSRWHRRIGPGCFKRGVVGGH